MGSYLWWVGPRSMRKQPQDHQPEAGTSPAPPLPQPPRQSLKYISANAAPAAGGDLIKPGSSPSCSVCVRVCVRVCARVCSCAHVCMGVRGCSSQYLSFVVTFALSLSHVPTALGGGCREEDLWASLASVRVKMPGWAPQEPCSHSISARLCDPEQVTFPL